MDRQASAGHVHDLTSVQGNTNLRIARYYQGTVAGQQILRFSVNFSRNSDII